MAGSVTWLPLALLAALLFGLHNAFSRAASEGITEELGAVLVGFGSAVTVVAHAASTGRSLSGDTKSIAWAVTPRARLRKLVRDAVARRSVRAGGVMQAKLVEVTSNSTEDYDRGRKFVHYQAIEALQHYLIVSHREQRVDHHVRLESGQWLSTAHTSPEAIIDLFGGGFRLKNVYEGIDLSEGT